MKVIVIHKAFEEIPVAVAEVNVPAEISDNIEEALEYAYRWTNNIQGSWSRDDIEDNGDYNSNVTRLVPLKNGYGLRSTSARDHMIVEGKVYEVDFFGFKEVA
jgi:hypothetical protein